MKLVVAIIQPHRLDSVRQALTDIGINGMTITEVRGYGRQQGKTEVYRGAEYEVRLLPKVRIEIAVTNEILDRVVEAISNSANTQKIGDGKIFVMDLESVLRIRTGEKNESALTS